MYSFSIFAKISLFVSECNLLLALFLLSRNFKSRISRLFFLTAFSMSIWALAESMQRAANNYADGFFWAVTVTRFAASFFSAFLLHFWLEFSGQIKKFRKKIPIIAIYLLPFLEILRTIFLPNNLVEVSREYWGYSITSGWPVVALMAGVIFYIFTVVFLALYKYYHSDGVIKIQARNIFIIMFIIAAAGSFTQGAHILFQWPVPELIATTSFVFIGTMAYTLNKYGALTITSKMVAEKIVTNVNDCMVTVDNYFKMVLINDALANLLGYGKSELVGMTIDVIFPKDVIVHLSAKQLDQQLPLYDFKTHILAKDKTRIPVAINVSTFKNEDEIIGFVFSMRDMRKINELIINLKARENELAEQFKELDRFNKIAGDREARVIELRNKLDALEKEVAQKGAII